MGEVVFAVGYILTAGGAVVETILASKILTAIAVNTLLSTVSSKLFGPKTSKSIGLSGVQVTTRSALEYRKIVYGQAMVSGPIYYNNLSGPDGQYLWYGVALCDGLSEDLISVWFDGNEIPKADIDWTAGTGASDGTGTGDVSTAKWVGDNSRAAAQIYYYLGDDAQPVPGDLNTAFTAITANHRLRGITHLVCQFHYHPDTERVWEAGVPQNIKALIKGRKVYDPRLDSTNGGTGTHRYTDKTTWAWSENPALCIADYLMNVMGVAATSIDWESIADAADDCEVAAAIPTATTEDRFTCNGALSMGSSHKDNLDAILSSMDGRLSYSGGVWKLRASVWEASSVTITADDLAGSVDVRGSAPKSERFNGVRGFFVDPARNYESVEFPHVSEATYITRDNGQTILYDLSLPMTNTATMAQRIAYRNLAQGNNQVICKLLLNARGSKISIGDVVSVTLDEFSWSAKTFRCIEWNRNTDGTFNVTLREDESTDYTDPVEGAYGIAGTGGVTIPSEVVPAPTGLTATGGVGGIRLDWTNPSAATFDYIDIYEDTDSGWTGATLIASVRASSYFVARAAGTTYYYWVRARRVPDLESLRSPDSDTSTVTGTATGGSDGNSIFVANVYLRSASAPATPTADSGQYNFTTNTLTAPTAPVTWYTTPQAGSDPLYVSSGTFSISGATGIDTTVTWTTPALLVSDGSAGPSGNSVFYASIFVRSATAPATPTGGQYNFTTKTLTAPTSPITWYATPPDSDGNPLYISTSIAEVAGTTGIDSTLTWTTPAKLVSDGAAGTSTITSQLTNPSYVVDANYDGTGYSLTGSGGTHEVFEGETSRTSSATHSVIGSATKNGLTMSVTSVGVYSLSGASWTTDQESFTLRAVYSTVTNDKTYTIAKARQGSDGGCAITTLTTVTLSDTGASTHTVGFRVDSDGDIYTRVNNAASYTSKETWIGACANTSYECYVTGTGDTPTGAALNTWHATSTDRQFEWGTTGGVLEEFTGTLQIRRTSDNQVLKTVNVTVEIGQAPTLTLNTLSSTGIDRTSPNDSTAGVRVLANGDVEELVLGTYTAQNSGTEWINDAGASSSDYEVQLTKTSGTDPTSGPALNSWNTISATRTWELNNTNAFDQTFVGTMTIREITNTSNSVSATVTLSTLNSPA